MPYSAEHKARTRARILNAATQLFRREGFAQTGVDTLMAEAGLTRGGFYAHFRDKIDLFVHALHAAFDESQLNLLARGLEGLQGKAWRAAATRRYLNLNHRMHAAMGCAIPSLGAEIARGPREVRRVFAKRFETLIDSIAERLGGDPAAARREAIALLSQWVGAMVIARAVPDRELAEEILEASQDKSDD